MYWRPTSSACWWRGRNPHKVLVPPLRGRARAAPHAPAAPTRHSASFSVVATSKQKKWVSGHVGSWCYHRNQPIGRASIFSCSAATMVLTAEDRRLLQASVSKLGCRLEDIGADALNRLFIVFPQSKTYFSHFNLSPGSKDIVHQGEKIGKALDSALKHLDDIRGTLSQLSDLHAYNLRVDPVNFQLLSKCFQVSLATHLRTDYNASTCLAWDKLIEHVSDTLCEKYR